MQSSHKSVSLRIRGDSSPAECQHPGQLRVAAGANIEQDCHASSAHKRVDLSTRLHATFRLRIVALEGVGASLVGRGAVQASSAARSTLEIPAAGPRPGLESTTNGERDAAHLVAYPRGRNAVRQSVSAASRTCNSQPVLTAVGALHHLAPNAPRVAAGADSQQTLTLILTGAAILISTGLQ